MLIQAQKEILIARERVAKLLAVRLEPLHRHSPGSFDLAGERTVERKRKRTGEWLDTDKSQEFALQEPPWDDRSTASSVEGWSKVEEGSSRWKIDELDEFCGRAGEGSKDREGIRPLCWNRNGYLKDLMEDVWRDYKKSKTRSTHT
jgi:hypothetical protein